MRGLDGAIFTLETYNGLTYVLMVDPNGLTWNGASLQRSDSRPGGPDQTIMEVSV